MRRREFLLGSLAAAAAPGMTGAQQPAPFRRIGYLSVSSAPSAYIETFRAAMRELGYGEANHAIEVRYADWKYDRLPALVDELIRSGIDVMVIEGPATIPAAPLAARSVPVVFGFSGDPVDAGIVSSLSRPGGNITGISFLSFDLTAKRVELLKEAVPGIARVAVLANPDHAGESSELQVTRKTAAELGLTMEYYQVRATTEFDRVFDAIARDRCDALLAFPDSLTSLNRRVITEFALQQRLPTIFGWRLFAEAGGLMSYGPNLRHAYLRVAVLVDRILKGAKPADIPIERPSRFELVVNLKTARALGLSIPRTIQVRADETIE